MNTPVTTPLFQSHSRKFEANRYVYPVLSRRAGGLSIGVNLNLDKICNFHCVYCQVNRGEPGEKEFIELPRLRQELDDMIELVASGSIWNEPPFQDTPEPLRRLNDIALSGDGEPTTYANFGDVVGICAEVRQARRLDDLKLVLITNASMFDRPAVQQALETLDANGGEIWAKLDAGTEAYYRKIAQSKIPFDKILANLLLAAAARPIVIQSLFMRLYDDPPPAAEVAAYCERLNAIVSGGGRIKLVQMHTVARTPAESWVTPLSRAELDAMAESVASKTGLPVAKFYGYGK